MVALAMVAAPAQEAPRPCVTRAQLEDLALFVLPPMLDALATKCTPSLPAGAYLLNGGRTLSTSLAAESRGSWAGANTALGIVAEGKMPGELSEETARGLVRDLSGSELKLKTEDCARINRLAELLSPLPPRNLAAVLSLVAEIGLAGGGKKKGPAICPAAAP